MGGDNSSASTEYAFLVYPTEALSKNTMLPYLTFAHGAEAGGNGTKGVYGSYGSLLQSVCSYGYVIVAPEACLGLCTSFYQDVMRTIMTVKSKKDALSKGLSIANFTKSGLFGHSMGGITTLNLADNATLLGLTTGVVMHGDNNESVNDAVEIPLFFLTGSDDSIINPEFVFESFQDVSVEPKVFAEIEGANHFEPCTDNPDREAAYIALWFDCWLKDNSTACGEYFFDSSSKNNICSGGPRMTSCVVNGTKTD